MKILDKIFIIWYDNYTVKTEFQERSAMNDA